jgi:CheY-like chemotaxis protein
MLARSSRVDGYRILVVDDNQDAAEILALTLEALGHDTRVACDGLDAIRVVQEFTPDVALLDLGMPAMDGYELMRHLQKQPNTGTLRFVAVTGYGQEVDRLQTSAAGFHAHLVKPVDVAVLQSVVHRLATESRKRR